MVPVRAALALLALLALSAAAAPTSVTPSEMAVYEKGFSAVQQGARTFRAEIRQTLYLQGVARPIVSTGVLTYAKPDRLLIKFSQPAGEWMLVNGGQVAIQKAGQPLQRRDLGGGRSHAANLLDFFNSDAARWHQNFDVSMTREGSRLLVQLKPWMTPTATAQDVDRILTTLGLPAYDLTGMEIAIHGANRIVYTFSNGARNVTVDPALFKIPAP